MRDGIALQPSSYSVQEIIINHNKITSNDFQCPFGHKDDSIEKSVGNGRFVSANKLAWFTSTKIK